MKAKTLSDNKGTWSGLIRYRENQIQGFSKHGQILVPDKIKAELKHFCGVCGKSLADQQTAKWFGEVFHKTCVSKMQRGENPA